MSNASTETDRLAWERGIDLDQSDFRFAPTHQRDRYETFLAQGFNTPVDLRVQEDDSLSDRFSKLYDACKPRWHLMNMASDIRRQMRDHVRKEIANGRLIGYGFALPRHADDAPRPVPADLWACKVDWETSKVSGNGLEFIAVRIVSVEMVEYLNRDTVAEQSSPRRPAGRPAVGPEIRAAFDALAAAGRVDFKAPMKHCYDLIRESLAARFPDRAGTFRDLADETIRKTISERYATLKKSNKQ